MYSFSLIRIKEADHKNKNILL